MLPAVGGGGARAVVGKAEAGFATGLQYIVGGRFRGSELVQRISRGCGERWRRGGKWGARGGKWGGRGGGGEGGTCAVCAADHALT